MSLVRARKVNTRRFEGDLNLNNPVAILLFLGVPEAEFDTNIQNFWLRNEGRLEFILYEAKQAYERSMKANHPDVGGGNENASKINVAYDRIVYLINKKLNPPPLIQPEQRVKVQRVEKIACRWCGVMFDPTARLRPSIVIKFCSQKCNLECNVHKRREEYRQKCYEKFDWRI